MNRKLANRFGSQWIKVKFFNQKPNLKEAKRLTGVRFCEATKEAVTYPVILDKQSLSCPSAQYVFGWKTGCTDELLQSCYNKQKIRKNILKSMLLNAPYFKKPFKYIGLNTEGKPDLVMSYMTPAEIMRLLKIFHSRGGKNLDVSLCSMMSICGGIAVKTYLEGKINLSFGCDDSRKFADIRRENLAIGIPNRLLDSFID